MMKLLNLFIAASIPVLKVLLITALGSYLALPRIHILGQDARKHLNEVVFYVFNPALVSSNLAETITYDNMVKMWFMPLNILLTFVVGSLLGWIVIQLTNPPSHLRGLILGCCSAGNLGNIFLIIIPAVCKEKGTPFEASEDCTTYGMAYASLSMATGAIFLWSYVYNIVRISSRSSTTEPRFIDLPISSRCSEGSAVEEPLIQNQPLDDSSKKLLVLEEDADSCSPPCIRTQLRPKVPTAVRIGAFVKSLNLKSLFAPSTIGAIAGFAIGLIPQIRNLMIGTDAPLRLIDDSAALLGNGAIPTVTLIIGGNLLKGLRGSELKKSIVISIVLARYIVLPLTGILIVRGAVKFGLVESDPLYMFVLLLQFAVPPAMNIGTITQLFGAGETECSVIMLWTYVLASVSLTFWSTLFMWLVA
ncbi:protein PIN-LIKES 3-like [Momordica charantia]|uniref:Protein PIN-LIKES 3-like n=1 Tax=Momordica charantia TaxID=3673 RepID=A0A6J1BW47_MOMCH|nr:protein PIN-LIKES 3-like [Momordica charantia]